MRRPSFAVTAFAIVILTLIGVFRVIYEPLLPSSPTEYLVTIPPSEAVPAPIVEINWKRSVREGQAEAKRRKLGVLVFLVDPSNYYAKQLELDGLRDPEVARFVERSFVAVKVNLDQYPEWAQAVLPLQRLGRYIEPGVELIAMDADGNLIDHFAVENPFQSTGADSILPFFISCQTKLGHQEQPLQSQQADDFQALMLSNTEPLPAFDDFDATLSNEFRFRIPGIFFGGSTKFRPAAIRVLAKTGHVSQAADVVRNIALSSLYDVVDGGFFREARTSPTSVTVDSSKSSSHNALSASVISQLACAQNDAELKQLAIDVGNEVITEFSDGDNLSASRLNDQGVDLRSRRSSLTERRLGTIFTGDQENRFLSFVTKDQNPDQDLAALKSLKALGNEEFQSLRRLLRNKLEYAPGLSEPDHIAVEGYIAARLFDLYRYTGDNRFLNKAKYLAEQVYSALNENSVARIYGNRNFGAGWLGTYLGFADCGMANYLATGEIYPLRNGAKVLRTAINTFRDPRTGLLANTPVSDAPGFQFTSAIPDLADRGRESSNAQAIRLAYQYSVIADDETCRTELASFTQSMMIRLNTIMHKANSSGAGYFDACYDVIHNKALIVSGPDRVNVANRLAKTYPFIPVFPLSVPNGDRSVQFYLNEGQVLNGPFTDLEIQKKLAEVTSPRPQ